MFKLEADIEVSPDVDTYNDGSSSTFGAPNVWTTDDVEMSQSFSEFRVVPEPSSFDILLVAGLMLLVRQRN